MIQTLAYVVEYTSSSSTNYLLLKFLREVLVLLVLCWCNAVVELY